MDKTEEKITLNDDQLEDISGGATMYGTAEGITCPYCGFSGKHRAELYYEREGNTTTFTGRAVFCGGCGAKLA